MKPNTPNWWRSGKTLDREQQRERVGFPLQLVDFPKADGVTL